MSAAAQLASKIATLQADPDPTLCQVATAAGSTPIAAGGPDDSLKLETALTKLTFAVLAAAIAVPAAV
jgi:hypothetical protein